jgi:hypothetical protein
MDDYTTASGVRQSVEEFLHAICRNRLLVGKMWAGRLRELFRVAAPAASRRDVA